MRQIVLDTETTGLETRDGHRIIEIGAVEMVNRRRTGRTFHQYLQPDREIDAGAAAVHGITNDQLVGKPRFADVAEDFLAFIRDAELVIHNAAFDIGFIDYEFSLLPEPGPRVADICAVIDTLLLARGRHPGQRNSLDALCKRYDIDNSQRELHGALLDSEILCDVYLAMTGGQGALHLGSAESDDDGGGMRRREPRRVKRSGDALRVIVATTAEREAHEAWLKRLDEAAGGRCLWRELEESPS
ncbi:DNA polymerase-3 subunit epsilon [Natronocella acetinitrilica]|uniref:DNA polymerase III subunit epsilon n=1 Tax=Natronocella acetinitrilica TaxID=414046 RepID=A0AAE3KDJ2_9GAMM|nr:DNA polymerase III subunit epsilon [Natronocella acetinitrilica]MCP1676909.1 DNA polymerase-3 subunit epsilon [Natronocella acetinitrilica]